MLLEAGIVASCLFVFAALSQGFDLFLGFEPFAVVADPAVAACASGNSPDGAGCGQIHHTPGIYERLTATSATMADDAYNFEWVAPWVTLPPSSPPPSS